MSSSIKRGETGTVDQKQASCHRNFAMENELFAKAHSGVRNKTEKINFVIGLACRGIEGRKFDYLEV